MVDLPDGEKILRKLSVGLVQTNDAMEKDGFLKYPYSKNLQRAINYLSFFYLMNGLPIPIGIGELIEKAKTVPLGEWQLNLSDDEYENEFLLNDEGVPTELCEELAAEELDYNNPDSFQRRIFESIKNLAESSKNPDITYTQIREFLVKYPLSTQDERSDILIDVNVKSNIFKELVLDEIYQDKIPSAYYVNGMILRCELCGNLIKNHRNNLTCTNKGCEFNKPSNGKKQKKYQELNPVEEVRQAHFGVRRYMSIPGIPELKLKDDLEKIGCKITLWPGLDLCDLFVETPSDFKISIDVKDWKYPHELARNVNQKPMPKKELENNGFSSDLYCYVFPDVRKKENPDYMNAFKSACNPKVEAFYAKEIIAKIKKKYGVKKC
ncbi:hypothetical protein ACP6PL_08300 [Dapis sp. BLCC M126]|uniref:restriction endonuclease-related protein n=1 Tax=Dapis sp. BLCC M126 TaxID=3400189 RepID=UPI003CF71E8F